MTRSCPGAHRVLVTLHIVPSCSADAPSPPSSANHSPAAGALGQSRDEDNIEAGALDQSQAGQQTELREATSCAGLWPPGPRDPDVSIGATLSANQRPSLRPGDQLEAREARPWPRIQRLNASKVTRCDRGRNLSETTQSPHLGKLKLGSRRY